MINTKRSNIMAPINCPSCGNEIPSNATYCPYCGNEIKSQIECPECGSYYNIDVESCQNCGEPNNRSVSTIHSKQLQVEKTTNKAEFEKSNNAGFLIAIGVAFWVAGAILIIKSFFSMVDLSTFLALVISGVVSTIIGIPLYTFGKARKNGASKSEAWDKVLEIIENINSNR